MHRTRAKERIIIWCVPMVLSQPLERIGMYVCLFVCLFAHANMEACARTTLHSACGVNVTYSLSHLAPLTLLALLAEAQQTHNYKGTEKYQNLRRLRARGHQMPIEKKGLAKQQDKGMGQRHTKLYCALVAGFRALIKTREPRGAGSSQQQPRTKAKRKLKHEKSKREQPGQIGKYPHL